MSGMSGVGGTGQARRTAPPLDFLDELGAPVTSVAIDSRQVKPGDVFLAYPGEHQDGRRFIAQAIAGGAGAVLWESHGFQWNPQWRVPNRGVPGLRAKAGVIASHVYGEPSRQLWVIGVTGTNGKTSCSQWLAQCLTTLGRKAVVIGTLGSGFPGELSAPSTTTPDPVSLHRGFAEYLRAGARCVAMEVSSHALSQQRVNGVAFDVALFTNLSRDHLDYHGTMDAYAESKALLLRWPGLKHAVLNLDDPFGARLAERLAGGGALLTGYGYSDGAARAARNSGATLIRGERLRLSECGIEFAVSTPAGQATLGSPMLGRFNAENLLAVLATLLASGVELDAAAAALEKVEAVPGRMQRVGGGHRPLVVVDYAHTPDALEKVLTTLRDMLRGRPQARLACVFGCGGERDRGKRALMGEVASRHADSVFVTSDNPRSEDPRAIIDDIIRGSGDNCHVIEDRGAAIFEAIAGARPGDLVLIAGKGHERYQEIGGKKFPFSDEEVARLALDKLASPGGAP